MWSNGKMLVHIALALVAGLVYALAILWERFMVWLTNPSWPS